VEVRLLATGGIMRAGGSLHPSTQQHPFMHRLSLSLPREFELRNRRPSGGSDLPVEIQVWGSAAAKTCCLCFGLARGDLCSFDSSSPRRSRSTLWPDQTLSCMAFALGRKPWPSRRHGTPPLC
jgi:hypothetical protein